jgi:hypothetical protein
MVISNLDNTVNNTNRIMGDELNETNEFGNNESFMEPELFSVEWNL